ncbi:pilus assembly protein PilP [Billgrantia pellis]|uniref:Pilus assembly protein PilP n=1 Tax=Billgrantia pellis TaxID=2606936 RepID=A0A7V7KHV3_9GAMM|nr:pilus assembly protein PilP [Halomonas pellis]KAA0012089.1 pilus assembly protein PilP [Halomonas pellis]
MRWLTLGMGCLLLSGCVDPELGELDRRLSDIRNDPGTPAPLEMPEVPQHEAMPYRESDRRSPFRPELPEPEEGPTGSSNLAPDPERPREPLEAFELASLDLVGVLTMSGESHALVKAPGGEVYRLRTGNYLGRNHGRIVSIADASIQLVELVSTGGGGWVERTAQMTLEDD